MEEPTGFDAKRVTDWLAEQLPDLVPPLRWTQLAGGHSNFTYRVDDSGGMTFVLRRPPLGELLPTAHDMGREFTVMSGLWPTPVPVPEPLAFCDDPGVTGAKFYAMGWVEGRPLYTALDAEEHLSIEARGRTGPSFIDTSIPMRSASAAWASATPTSAASCTAGMRRGTRRRRASCPTWTACTISWWSVCPSSAR